MNARARTICLLALAALAARGTAQGAERPGVLHAEMMARLKAAAATGRVQVVSLGRSTEGRTIPLVALGPETATTRVLTLCRQHGNEVASTEAALRVVERAARGDLALAQALGRTQLLLAPMVNPDGAERHTRANANQADLNRDWRLLTQPETRAVARAFRLLSPHVVLDAHQWLVDEHGTDFLETAPDPGQAAETLLHRVAAVGESRGVPLRAATWRPFSDPRLAHRAFHDRGSVAFLLESRPSVGLERQTALYEAVFVRMAREAGAVGWKGKSGRPVSSLPALFPSPQGAPAPPTASNPVPMAVVAAFALWLVAAHSRAFRPAFASEESGVPRRFRRRSLGSLHELCERLERRRVLATSLAASGCAEKDQRRAACMPRISSTSPRLSPARRAMSAASAPSSASRRTVASGRPSSASASRSGLRSPSARTVSARSRRD